MQYAELLHLVRERHVPVAVDSRQVQAGGVFVAVPGVNADGMDYVDAALDAGAGYVVCQQPERLSAAQRARATVAAHPDARRAVWELAQALYGTDNLPLRVIGITGTNGKTTTAHVLEHVFTRLGHKVGILGTVGYRWPGHVEPAPLTTPDSLSLHRMLAAMAADGVTLVVMEASSHALEQQRVGGIDFAGAVFSNLTQDHLDFHADMDAYFADKALLFTHYPRADKAMAINADDPWGRRLLSQCPQALAFSLGGGEVAHGRVLRGRVVSMSDRGLQLEMRLGDERWQVRSPLVGAFNAANLMAVQAVALEMGATPGDMRHLEDFYGVPGRLERVDNPQGLHVFVDYAHTPDALTNVLTALRGAGFARVVTVFGCGGNRDKTKRPLMGQAVGALADAIVVTSDNPRFEDPEAIIADILPGLEQARARGVEVYVEPDRREATRRALLLLQGDDALCIAGKGHEDYQIVQGVKRPYSDQQTVRELLSCV